MSPYTETKIDTGYPKLQNSFKYETTLKQKVQSLEGVKIC